MSGNSRSLRRFWCMTFNNYTPAVFEKLHDWCKKETTYYVIGKEVSGTGTPHLQCFIGLKTRMRLTRLKAELGSNPHLEPAAASGETASNYCKKGEQSHEEWSLSGASGANFGKNADFVEGGVIPNTAKAVAKVHFDYAQAVDSAKKRKFDEIDPALLVRYYGNLQRIAADNPVEAPDLPDCCAEWIYGPPGTGKSFTARRENPVFFDKSCNKWWCGYKGEPVVILDDLDKNHKVLGHHLKRWLDRYSFVAEVKGTSLQIRPQKIVITSNYHPNEIWDEDPTLAQAIERRVKIRLMTEVYQGPRIDENPDAHNFRQEDFQYEDFDSVDGSRELIIAGPLPTEDDDDEVEFVEVIPPSTPVVKIEAPSITPLVRPFTEFEIYDITNNEEFLRSSSLPVPTPPDRIQWTYDDEFEIDDADLNFYMLHNSQ